MTRFDLLTRLITAAGLVALAVTLGVWLSHPSVTAAPDVPPIKITPEPILAPTPAPARVVPATIEVPVQVEISAPAAAPPESPAAKPSETTAEPRPVCPPCRRGIFGRRLR
jgi:hypothetical protein